MPLSHLSHDLIPVVLFLYPCFRSHTDTVATVGFSADGTLAATGCYGGLLKVWEAATGAAKHTLEGPEDIECLA